MKVGYAFIGTPKGLQTKNGGAIKSADIRQFVDLNSSEIRVFPNTELLMVKKVVSQQDIYYIIAQYEYAKEIESERTGTFFGGALVLKNAIAPPEAILLVLNQLMSNLRAYIATDGRFRAEFDRISLPEFRRLKGLESNLTTRTIDTSNLTNKAILINLGGEDDFREKANFLDQALGGTVLEPFTTIYATDDNAIIDFVQREKSMRLASLGASYESMTEQLERKYAYLNNQFEQGKDSYNNLRNECEKLSQSAKQLVEQRNKLQLQYEETKRKVAENMTVLDAAIQNRQDELTDLEQEQVKAQQTLLQLKEQCETAEKQMSPLKKEQQQLEATIAQLKKAQQDLQISLETLQSEQQTLIAKNEALETLKTSEIEI